MKIPSKNKKLYYSIKEVAEMFDINESTIRILGKGYSVLKPSNDGDW